MGFSCSVLRATLTPCLLPIIRGHKTASHKRARATIAGGNFLQRLSSAISTVLHARALQASAFQTSPALCILARQARALRDDIYAGATHWRTGQLSA